MRKNVRLAVNSAPPARDTVALDRPVSARNDDTVAPGPLLVEILREALAANSTEIHFEQSETLCRVRKRVNGQLDEVRIDSSTLTDELLSELATPQKPLHPDPPPDHSERCVKLKLGHTDYLLEYLYYPTSSGTNLTIQIHCEARLPETLDQTLLNTSQIHQIRNHLSRKPRGMTIVYGKQHELLQSLYYGFIGDANCIENKIVSIEQINRKQIARVNHIAIAELCDPGAISRLAAKHADLIFVDSQCTNDHSLLTSIINNSHSLFLFINAATATGAIARLTDVAISERQLASNLTTLIQLENTRMVCPHCAHTHEINGTDMEWLQHNRLGRASNAALVYAAGCDRCDFSGSQSSRTLASVCTVEDNLRRAIESRNAEAIDSATRAIVGTNSIADQIAALVALGKVSFTEYKTL